MEEGWVGHEKPIYKGKLLRGVGQFAGLRGGLVKKREGCF